MEQFKEKLANQKEKARKKLARTAKRNITLEEQDIDDGDFSVEDDSDAALMQSGISKTT